MQVETVALRARTMACIVLAGFLVVAGCGGSDDADVRDRAESALRSLEPDLERLSEAVEAVDAGDRATLVEVQASGQRASESLGDARRRLRDLEQAQDVGPETLARLSDQIDAVRDVQELADALGQPTLSSPRIEAASSRARPALEDLRDVIDAPILDAELFAQDLRDTRNRDAQRRAERQSEREADQDRTGQPSAPVGETGAGDQPTSYIQYTGPAFQARLPTGPGWGAPSSSEPTPGRLFRTNTRGPRGLFVIIDYTPFEEATFGGSFRSRTVVGQTAFGQAVRYEFRGGTLPECQQSTCYDYIINDPATGQGFAVLAGGGPGAAEIARTVAESVTPTG